ncbi:uncharacterized protein FOMMEDRAFT_151775 [Fomitiporia mediterranea MF3/22]|uniref:uncharacterized protein n=1 Tax=Fomitiporia mediterranea (strain MF3/22) TaxID=694068 RepID=UPI0004407707|nr:uncharacterized protein FOMMEDRAFT_151775 [Fomitiporia mediterranea MF3/22]EJD06503.1 hypothetical protein FOMMEDRAFT_151775 [Fomitiporia mediterranea MF3/22]
MGPRRPPLTSPEPSPPAPPTSSSPFEPERPRDTPSKSSTTITEFTAPPIARRVVARACNVTHPHSLHAVAVRPSFHSYCHLLITLSSSHRRSLNLHNLLNLIPHTLAVQLAGTEQRPKRGDEDYIERPENAVILVQHKSHSQKNEAEAAGGVGVGTVEMAYYLLFLYSII